VWSNFKKSEEIVNFGNSDRFRIIYKLINDIELKVFNLDVSYFYLTNIIVFAIFLFGVFYITQANLDYRWAILFTLFVSSQKYLVHIFTRLGTAEVWTILGTSVYFLGVSSIYRKSLKEDAQSSTWKEVLAMLIGAIITIGSKENFAIMGIFVVSLYIFLKIRKKVTPFFTASSIMILLFNLYQVLHIYLTHSSKGVDVYANDVSLLHRFLTLLSGAFSGEARMYTLFFITFFISIVIGYIFTAKKRLEKIKDIVYQNRWVNYLFIGAILFVVYIFNLYVYNGLLYPVHRYAFPSILVLQIISLIWLIWLIDFSIILNFFKKEKFLIRFQLFIFGALMVALFLNGIYAREASFVTVARTNYFNNNLERIMNTVKQEPESVIILSVYNVSDAEPVVSTAEYLRFYGVKNPIMVKGFYKISSNFSPIEIAIERVVSSWESFGAKYISAYNLQDDNKCFNINFSGTEDYIHCENLGRIWQQGEFKY